MLGGPTFEVYEANTRVQMTACKGWISAEEDLPLRNVNALPSESTRIQRPGPGSEHRQRGAQSPEQDVDPRIGGMRQGETKLGESHQHTRERCPYTKQQQSCSARSHQVRDDQHREQSCDSMSNGRNRRYRPQKHEPGAGPTFRKCRETPLHKRSRS